MINWRYSALFDENVNVAIDKIPTHRKKNSIFKSRKTPYHVKMWILVTRARIAWRGAFDWKSVTYWNAQDVVRIADIKSEKNDLNKSLSILLLSISSKSILKKCSYMELVEIHCTSGSFFVSARTNKNSNNRIIVSSLQNWAEISAIL